MDLLFLGFMISYHKIKSVLKYVLAITWVVAAGVSPCCSQTYSPYTVTVYDTASTGYYFLCPINYYPNLPLVLQTHMILDDRGRVVYYKSFPPGQRTGDFKLQPNGTMTYSTVQKFFVMDSTFTVIDSIEPKNGITLDAHDLQILPNGNYLTLGTVATIKDLSMYNLFGPNNVPGSTTATVHSGVIQEQDSNKNVVFEWFSKDHFAFDEIDEHWLVNPNFVDWTHCNSIELTLDGNLLLSSRHFNELTKIDHQTGNIIWRLGGNANQFTFLNDAMGFTRQHDARMIPNGHITVFDNGSALPNNPIHAAEAKEYEVDETNMTATLVWSYIDDMNQHSPAMGNFQRVPGGNSLIDYGQTIGTTKLFNVVNENGQKIFEVAFEDTLFSYRAFNYPSLPWNLNRPQITCYENGGQYYLDAGPGYVVYLWSDGSTSQVIPLTDTGTYSVFVPKGLGGYVSSDFFEVTDLSDPCGLTGVHSEPVSINVYPNPVSDNLTINFNDGTLHEFEIYNSASQLIYSGKCAGRCEISAKTWSPGIYSLRYGERVKKIMTY